MSYHPNIYTVYASSRKKKERGVIQLLGNDIHLRKERRGGGLFAVTQDLHLSNSLKDQFSAGHSDKFFSSSSSSSLPNDQREKRGATGGQCCQLPLALFDL